jgi:hypothetical protein
MPKNTGDDDHSERPHMTLDRALSYVIGYTKFIAALWATYIGLTVTIIGWLLTLRGTRMELSGLPGFVVIPTYLGVSFIFHEVLHQNHRRLIGLMQVTDVLAAMEAEGQHKLKTVYDHVFKTGNAPELLQRTEGIYLGIVAFVAAIFMLAIVVFPATPPNSNSSPSAAATQAAPAR